ncbi:Sec23-binding domain of Sec16-domain-containing protein [Mycotypha africana]|uniref:Sec23-binding domain of Sec16-domain-containing protein n=1 Tax=Mycotypha africana TaxID=64632 RepID=UPI0023010FDB|nr:Sec23-binding domain of Sec16-domain-containing protein [Mycotypha africana]KAI8988005.1 Sec23-binding domain of Sec16-domain-containing protein [Mycotypha africana]
MSTPHVGSTQGEWYQFDPNVHYYYDEQGQLHYYDPNTNLDVNYQPEYQQQEQQPQQQLRDATAANAYYASPRTSSEYQPNSYYTQHNNSQTPQQLYTPDSLQQQPTFQQPSQQSSVSQADIVSSRQPSPEVPLLPCPDPNCTGENKPTSKFCEECGIALGPISRTGTPVATNNTGSSSVAAVTGLATTSLTRSMSNNYISDNSQYKLQQQRYQHQLTQKAQNPYYAPHHPTIHRPPTAPVYSTTTNIPIGRSSLDTTVPLYHPPSVKNTVQPSIASAASPSTHLSSIQSGAHHPSMYDLRAYDQNRYAHTPLTTTPTTSNAINNSNYPSSAAYSQQQHQSQLHQPSVDPLGRSRGCPIVVFGFGGKMVMTFPRTVPDYYSSTSNAQPGPIQIKQLKDVTTTTKDSIEPVFPKNIVFPGPVMFDSKVGNKQKKRDIIQYMSQMLEALEKEKSTFTVYDSEDYHRLEAKILLWKVIKVMIECDGKLNDKDKKDQAILAAIRPLMPSTEEDYSQFNYPTTAATGMDTPSITTATRVSSESNTSTFDSSNEMLGKIERYLLNGDRLGAVNFAIQEDLWAHALIISSCVDRECWQRVIKNFVDREMNSIPETSQNRNFNIIAGNNQALRVIYSLFSGVGAASMNQFIVNDIQHVNTPYGLQTVTPKVEISQLAGWRSTLAIILANRTSRDLEALTALGDILKTQGWTEAAHICYLLSPQTSIHSGDDTAQVRLTLVGSDQPTAEALCLSEIFEYANSWNTSNNASTCLPFLQGYKLKHAWILADYGCVDLAKRYYESIDQCLKSFTKGSPYLHSSLVEQVNVFGSYISNNCGRKNGVDPASWFKPKLQKKTLSSIWGSLEGSLTKFVSGEESPSQEPPARKSSEIMGRFQ